MAFSSLIKVTAISRFETAAVSVISKQKFLGSEAFFLNSCLIKESRFGSAMLSPERLMVKTVGTGLLS